MVYPRANLRGIDDHSTVEVPYNQRPRAQHTPLFLLMTKRGPVDPVYIDVDGFDIFYSLQSLGVNSPWYTHQSELVKIAIEVGNSTAIVKRIIDEYSKTASCVIGMDTSNRGVVDKTLDTYLDAVKDNSFKPLITIEASDPGEWGNYVGIEIFKADEKKQETLGRELDSVVYEARVIVEDEKDGHRRVLNNLYGEPSTFFSVNPSARANGLSYFFDDIMHDSYIEDIASVTRQPYFSKFALHVKEVATLAETDTFYKEDVFGKLGDMGALGFKKGKPFFCKGGHDGMMTEQGTEEINRLDRQRRYDQQVQNWLESIDDTNPIVDIARYPFNAVWDSGFTKQTKEAFVNLVKYRKDAWIAMATTSRYRYIELANKELQFEPSPKLQPHELISLSTYYRSLFSGLLESPEYGTPFVRGTLVIQDGIKLNSDYKDRQSLNVDLFEKVARYAGNASGKLNGSHAFDQEDKNVLLGWSDISLPYMAPSLKESAWNNGVIYVEARDHTNYFYPMFQTLYPHDNSVLNSIFVMMACSYIQYMHHLAWTQISGNSKETNEVLASKVDTYLNSNLLDAFDGRFIVEAQTYYTEADNALGFKFTTDTTLYAAMTKHTANFKINAYRMQNAPASNS